MIYRSWQYILGIFLIHLSFTLSGQSPLTAYQLASGGTKTIQLGNLPTLNNPLTRLDQNSGNTIIASTEERYFSGISSSFLSYSYTGNKQALTVGFHDYGIEEFSLDTWSAGYARQLTDELQIAARFKYLNLSIQELNNNSAGEINLDISVSYMLLEKLRLSVMAENLNQSSELVSSFYNLGAQLKISDQVSLHAEYQYDLADLQSTLVAGIAYSPVDQFKLLIGVNSTFQGPAIGLHYEWKSVFIAGGVNNHFQLGQTGSLTLGARF